MKLQIEVDSDGVIVDAKFKTFGCGSAIGSCSNAYYKCYKIQYHQQDKKTLCCLNGSGGDSDNSSDTTDKQLWVVSRISLS